MTYPVPFMRDAKDGLLRKLAANQRPVFVAYVFIDLDWESFAVPPGGAA